MDNKLLFFLSCCILSASGQTFSGCDYIYELQASQSTTITNNQYSSAYPTGSSCRFQVVAPSNYKVSATCYINIGYSGNSCGANDLFRFITDGTTDILSSRASGFCGYTESYTFTSQFNSLTFGYTSSQFQGLFYCQITTTADSTCDCGWNVNTRILGGSQASPNTLASMVGLYAQSTDNVFCGGVIISVNCILTAAHCVSSSPYNNAANLFALVGRQDVSVGPQSDTIYSYTYAISSILKHQSYVPNQSNNDIALLYTSRKIAWNRGVAPVCLPNPNNPSSYDNAQVLLAGWGTTSFGGQQSPKLLVTTVSVYPLQQCQSALPSEQLYSSQICTSGQGQRDSCQYDSGGPVLLYSSTYQRYFCIGIIDQGPPCGVNSPSINARVTSYVSWIQYYAGSGQSFCQYNN